MLLGRPSTFYHSMLVRTLRLSPTLHCFAFLTNTVQSRAYIHIRFDSQWR